MFKRLCVIGLGLIGSSLARAIRHQGLCDNIVAYGRAVDLQNLHQAKQLKVIDNYFINIEEAVAGADCVLIATPVGAVKSVFELLRPCWRDDVVYTDVCSTKGSVIAAIQSVFAQVPANFVPAHPIAGAECSGVEAGRADLFDHKRLIITPLESTNIQSLEKVTQLWEGVGAQVAFMEVKFHDTVLAATSHLPHILAFALVDLLGRKDEQQEIFQYAAGGFKDFTRIASSDPTMWRDICLANKLEIIPLIQQLQSELDKIEQLLIDGDKQQLFATFSYAGNARQRFLDQLEK